MSTPDSKKLLDTIIEGLGQPFYAIDKDWRIFLYNSEAARHFGKPASEMIGKRILIDVFAADADSERGRIIKDAMAGGKVVKGEALSMVGRHVSYVMFPLGEGLGVLFQDITERRLAEARLAEAEEASRKRAAELEAVLETIPTAVWFTKDPQARQLVANRRAIEMLHMPKGVLPSLSRLPPEQRPYRFYKDGQEVPADQLPLQRAARGEIVTDELLEVRFNSKDYRFLLMRSAPLRGPSGNIQGAVCAAADVTERHHYEEHLKLLVEELNHRVRNTLAIVQSIANQTFKHSDPKAATEFEKRLLNLSGVHTLLTEQHWQGAGLRDLVSAVLKPYLAPSNDRLGRVAFAGENIRLKPRSAVAFSMAIHELATNAAKYGALSTAQGSVDVRWTTDAGRLGLRWQESGGPEVSPPTHHGFGTLMVKRGLAAELHGDVAIDYDRSGVICTIDAPLQVLGESA
ncbi:MAG TPA: HWE histidine kinase domain-containing protein [Reyranella sp.]|nr:HWE histidine kinase domain-containing protein [Reyranella sp.]